MFNSRLPVVRLSDLLDGEGRLHACRHAERLQRILEREGIDNRCQHTYVVAGDPVDPFFFSFFAAKDVAAAEDDPYLCAELPDFPDLACYLTERPVVYATFFGHQHLTA